MFRQSPIQLLPFSFPDRRAVPSVPSLQLSSAMAAPHTFARAVAATRVMQLSLMRPGWSREGSPGKRERFSIFVCYAESPGREKG